MNRTKLSTALNGTYPGIVMREIRNDYKMLLDGLMSINEFESWCAIYGIDIDIELPKGDLH